jgi:hypothetical protein
MRDKDIRPALKAAIQISHPGAVVYDELPLCRAGRADIAAVNCALWGYEIKSEVDTLNRLPLQIGFYDSVFDYSIAVAAKRHIRYARRILPKHWGITVVEQAESGVVLDIARKPSRNSNVCVQSLIRLVWKNEAVKILRSRDVAIPKNALVREIWDLLAGLRKRDLQESIRDALKVRMNSGPAVLQTSGDDSSPIAATAERPLVPVRLDLQPSH